MREVKFDLPFEIPQTKNAKSELKWYLESLGLDTFGKFGRPVGIGFLWYTKKGLLYGGLVSLCALTKRFHRALCMTGVVSRQAEPYNLTQRIIFITDAEEPHAVIELRED